MDSAAASQWMRSVKANDVAALTGDFEEVVRVCQPKIFRFVEKRVIEEAQRLVGSEGLVKILIVPGLPRDAKTRQRSIEVLRSKGVDGVISFRSILQELVASVAINHNYRKSDLLQILRLLKNYELLKEPQLEFGWKRRSRKAAS